MSVATQLGGASCMESCIVNRKGQRALDDETPPYLVTGICRVIHPLPPPLPHTEYACAPNILSQSNRFLVVSCLLVFESGSLVDWSLNQVALLTGL